MGLLYNALHHVSPVEDAEVLDGYRRYEAVLESILTPEQIAHYAAHIDRTGEVRIFEEMTPNEIAQLPLEMQPVATAVLADAHITMENRRVVALLSQHGEHKAVPDFE